MTSPAGKESKYGWMDPFISRYDEIKGDEGISRPIKITIPQLKDFEEKVPELDGRKIRNLVGQIGHNDIYCLWHKIIDALTRVFLSRKALNPKQDPENPEDPFFACKKNQIERDGEENSPYFEYMRYRAYYAEKQIIAMIDESRVRSLFDATNQNVRKEIIILEKTFPEQSEQKNADFNKNLDAERKKLRTEEEKRKLFFNDEITKKVEWDCNKLLLEKLNHDSLTEPQIAKLLNDYNNSGYQAVLKQHTSLDAALKIIKQVFQEMIDKIFTTKLHNDFSDIQGAANVKMIRLASEHLIPGLNVELNKVKPEDRPIQIPQIFDNFFQKKNSEAATDQTAPVAGQNKDTPKRTISVAPSIVNLPVQQDSPNSSTAIQKIETAGAGSTTQSINAIDTQPLKKVMVKSITSDQTEKLKTMLDNHATLSFLQSYLISSDINIDKEITFIETLKSALSEEAPEVSERKNSLEKVRGKNIFTRKDSTDIQRKKAVQSTDPIFYEFISEKNYNNPESIKSMILFLNERKKKKDGEIETVLKTKDKKINNKTEHLHTVNKMTVEISKITDAIKKLENQYQ